MQKTTTNTTSCDHTTTRRYAIDESRTNDEVLEWCSDCGAIRVLRLAVQGSTLAAAAMEAWRFPRNPLIPTMVCPEHHAGQHQWRDHGEHISCVVYRCELCDAKGLGAPGVPDVPHVPGRIGL